MYLRPFATVALLLLVVKTEGKTQSGFLSFGGEHGQEWHYLGKFGYAVGSGRYEIRLRLDGPLRDEDEIPKVDLDIFLDEEWPQASSYAACDRATEVPARKSHSLIEPGLFGEWGHWHGGALWQSIRPHFWYFAISDCRNNFDATLGEDVRTPYRIEYEIRWVQFDESELSLELRYMPMASSFALVILAVLGVGLIYKCYSMQQSLDRLHPVVYALAMAMLLQGASQMLHLYHLKAYENNGFGHPTADMFAEVLFQLSQVAGASLLIAIAQGYTLVRSKLSEVQLLTPVVAVVAVLHVLLVAVGKLQTSCKYYENEGIVGWMLLVMRMGLLVWFRSGIKSLRHRNSTHLNNFLRLFELAGSAYFLAFPAVFVFVQVLAAYLQNPVLQTALLAVQTVAWLWLAGLFLSRGSYYEASELSASLLPGGAGAHCFSPSAAGKAKFRGTWQAGAQCYSPSSRSKKML